MEVGMIHEPPRSVLVLDDEADARQLVRLVLERLGYTVHGARDGKEALRLVGETDVSVALVDLLMPGMSGREFLERVGGIEPGRRPVCIVNSARRAAEVRAELRDLDVFGILTKPFEIHDLEERIAVAWEEKKQRLGP